KQPATGSVELRPRRLTGASACSWLFWRGTGGRLIAAIITAATLPMVLLIVTSVLSEKAEEAQRAYRASSPRIELLEMWHAYYEAGCYANRSAHECKTHGMKSTGNPKDSFDWKLSPCERVERILKDHADGEDAGE